MSFNNIVRAFLLLCGIRQYLSTLSFKITLKSPPITIFSEEKFAKTAKIVLKRDGLFVLEP